MKKVIVNALKMKCSKGRIEKGETVILPDEEIEKITKIRPAILTVLEDVKPVAAAPAKPAKTNGAKVAKKPTKRSINVKSKSLN